LKETRKISNEVGDERLALYRSFKAVTGLGDPISPKNQERGVKGVLKYVFGDIKTFRKNNEENIRILKRKQQIASKIIAQSSTLIRQAYAVQDQINKRRNTLTY